MRTKIILLLLACASLHAKTFYYFTPPSDWECADPTHLSPHVEVGFFGKGENSFHPSLNLATEEVGNLTLKEYLKAVQEIHESDRNSQWRDLGKFKTAAGIGELTEITTANLWGQIRMLQLVLVANGTAYVLTGAMPKEEFAAIRKTIVEAFRSFTFTEDLFSALKDPAKKEKLHEICHSLTKAHEKKEGEEKARKELETYVLKNCKEMGAHWQIIFLKEILSSFPEKS